MAKEKATAEDRAARKAAKRDRKDQKKPNEDGVKKSKSKSRKEDKPQRDTAAGLLEKALEDKEGKANLLKSKRKDADMSEDGERDESDVDGSASEAGSEDVPSKRSLDNHKISANDVQYETVNGIRAVKGLLAPWADPIAGPKNKKRLLRGVLKASPPGFRQNFVKKDNSQGPSANLVSPAAKKANGLKRGVKEVNKGITKIGGYPEHATDDTLPNSVVVFAADISPMDVMIHMPFLCEEHNVPYAFVDSRHDLGAACCTRRSTSVVQITKERKIAARPRQQGDGKGENAGGDDQGEDEKFPWESVYKDIVKVVRMAASTSPL